MLFWSLIALAVAVGVLFVFPFCIILALETYEGRLSAKVIKGSAWRALTWPYWVIVLRFIQNDRS